ncbi:hypothetical protein HII31_00743 [Pseudocercospora fuligena]|uniref:Uncharacterized protein n=1 Tax=Pseudocercospora fuligena TaxID=685502 RepID=A0A8H6VRM8_9PEZI|nr:hypothetical protein HII31_00743 [Pseudocercospora fuligena]
MGRKHRHRRRRSPPARGSMESRALIRTAQSPGIYYALPLLRDFADNEPLTTYRGRKRCPPSIPRDQASDVLHAADRTSCRSEREGGTWQLPYRPRCAIGASNADLSTHTSRIETSTAMTKHMREAALHRARRPRVTYGDRCRAAADRATIDTDSIDENYLRKNQAKRQRTEQGIIANMQHGKTVIDTGARLIDNSQPQVHAYGRTDESIVDQAERVSQDVNQLFVRTGDLLETAQGRVAALEQVLAHKAKEADGLRAQVVKLTADLEIEKVNAKRTEQSGNYHDKIIATAKALVASDFEDMGARMQELAEAVRSDA